ncbi:MAG: FkbM family methyltransferase [Rhodocyclaceae bacterium]|nr:FkbM family methyltransferase [Rhodocyclaceae bacterium]MCA3059066.1 FkbM family methyltransferase [Rhodocyclaceae bacterium]MCA3082438.1 FkbM family methyltransferase [Rhodocyclaceae bacterium]MCE2723087.1 FkbM family methyltransferase [Betaproteobacteria bacterium]
MKNTLRQLARTTLKEFNLELRKFPGGSFKPAPIFDLAIHCLMEQRGQAIQFVQVGANDGVHVDPIRKYVLRHPWEGLLVEPQPAVFSRLVENYSAVAHRLKFENCAVSPTAKSVTLFCAPDLLDGSPEHSAAVVSVDAATTARQLGVPRKSLRSITVPCVTLAALFEAHAIVDLDLLQIDVEGHDLEVLLSMDFANHVPRVIQFESGHLSPNDCRRASDLLYSFGYSMFWGGYQGDAVALSQEFCSFL